MKLILTVESNCSDPNKESEFNDWYNNIHLPDIMELAEVKSAARYQNLNPSDNGTKYLAVYEVEADDLQKVLEKVKEHVKEKAAQGRMSNLLSFTRSSQFKLIYFLDK